MRNHFPDYELICGRARKAKGPQAFTPTGLNFADEEAYFVSSPPGALPSPCPSRNCFSFSSRRAARSAARFTSSEPSRHFAYLGACV
jgi:hypothetical protein